MSDADKNVWYAEIVFDLLQQPIIIIIILGDARCPKHRRQIRPRIYTGKAEETPQRLGSMGTPDDLRISCSYPSGEGTSQQFPYRPQMPQPMCRHRLKFTS